MQFTYKAKNLEGKEIAGTREATDKFELARVLRKDGYTLVSSHELKGHAQTVSFLSNLFGRVSVAEKMIFSRNIAVMISAGLPLAKALDILEHQAKNKKFKQVLSNLADEIRKGSFMSDGMQKHPEVFSPLFVSMVKAGEEGGNLDESFRLIGHQLEREHFLLRKIRGALVYPAIIVIAMIIIGILMLVYVVPTLVSTFEELNVDVPASTQFIISASAIITLHPILFLLALAAASFVGFSLFKTEKGKEMTTNVFLRLPVLGPLVQKINSARTARTLASLTSSGVEILRAIKITEEVLQNRRYKKVLREAGEVVQKGEPLSGIFKKHIESYPILVGEMMAVGEETGKMSDMLFRLADFYEEEVAESTKDLSTVIEPVLMLIIGTVVGFFAISMISPMYSMLGGI